MEKIDAFKTALRGKKTYLAVAIGALYMLGVWAELWEYNEVVLGSIGLSGLAFLRAAIPKGNGTQPGMAAPRDTTGLMPTLLLVGTLCLIQVGLTGCSSVAPGNDPAVVRAQQTIVATYDLAASFLSWEEENRAIVGEDVQEFADKLREEFPPLNRSARKLLKTYKANRTEQNKANLDTALKTLEALKGQVRSYFTLPPISSTTRMEDFTTPAIWVVPSEACQKLGLIDTTGMEAVNRLGLITVEDLLYQTTPNTTVTTEDLLYRTTPNTTVTTEDLLYLETPTTRTVTEEVRSGVHPYKGAAPAVSPLLVLGAIDAVIKLIGLIGAWVQTGRQNKEWTPEEQEQIDAKMEEAFAKATFWQPRAKAKASKAKK
jgi:hypothetical protein